MSWEPPSYDSIFGSPPGPSFSEWRLSPGLTVNEAASQTNISDSPRDLLTLPDDIVGQIFVHACQPTLDPHSDIKWRREFYPLWLGQICREWRRSAWQCSELWTYVVIRIQISRDRIRSQINILEQWIERAKGRPLNIYVEHTRGPFHRLSSTAADLQMDLLALLCRYSEQWKRIDMNLPYQCFAPPENSEERLSSRLPFLGLSLPLLQYAAIHIRNVRRDAADPQLDLKQAPLLRTLSITEEALISCCPTKQITRLALNSCSFELDNLFRHFPKLTELTWTKANVRRLPQRPLTYNHLQSFDVDIDSVSRFFLHYVCFPALKSLSIRTRKIFPYTQTLQKFFLQSGCALTHLTIECQVKLEHDLIDLLSSSSLSSSLQELYIRHVPPVSEVQSSEEHAEFGLSRTFFDTLHPDEDPNYLTRLEILEYEGPLTVQAIDFIEPLLIRSRIRAVDSPRPMDGLAVLKRAKIKSDQFSAVSEFSIAEYTDAQYVWEVLRALEEGVLVLSNLDGSMWE